MRNRHWLFSLVLAGLIFLPTIPVNAQAGQQQKAVRFEHLTVEDGLPHATVLGVLQGQQGFIWFATADGLSRYDGREFKNFQHERKNPNSLSNNNTFALLESRDGLIWVGTDPGGLNVYDPSTGNFSLYLHDKDDPNSLADDSIWALLEDRDGNIWVGTRNGLSRLDRETGLFLNYMPDADDPRSLAAPVVYRIYEDSEGTIWIGGNGGLQRYEPETDDFTTFVHDPEDDKSLSSSNVWSMLEDNEGNFWVGTRRKGLNLFDRETGKVIQYFYHNEKDPTTLSDDNIWNIFEDSQGNIWFLTEFGGINRYLPDSESFVAYQHNPNDYSTLSNNDVFWMAEDSSGVLWFSCRYGGVNKLYNSLSQFGLYRSIPGESNSLSSNEVYSVMEEENGTVWIGTFGGGLNRFDRSTGKMTVYVNDPEDPTSLLNNKVYYLHRGADDSLWVATYGGGLNRFDQRTGEFTVYTNTEETPYGLGIKYPTTLENAEDGKLWVGTLGFGLFLFNPKTAEIEVTYEPIEGDETSLTEGTVYDMALDGDGDLWVATARGGLDMLDPATGVFSHHLNNPDENQSILSNTVYALYWDAENEIIWAATADGLSGLNKASGEWINYTKEDGLSSDTLMGIQPGVGNTLWISSTKGINRLSLDTDSIRHYFVADGLQGDQFQIASSHLGPNGEIFFGGSNGVTYFIPEQLEKNQYLPDVVFTEFFLNNRSVPVGSDVLPQPIEKTKSITLDYEDNVFTIKFAALNYQLSEKNLYQYKLEGFEDNWSPVGYWDSARYTNLAPGDYTFLVRAANNDGLWNPDEASIDIHILRPWWQTLWFYLALVFLIAGAFWAIMRYRLRSVRLQKRELEEHVCERTRELALQLNEVSALQVKLQDQAIRDALTGLYNRRYFADVLEKELARARRQSQPLVFMLLDLDRFKKVNDTYGHTGGDKALIALSDLLRKYTRSSDYAFRYGGEEFMLLMPDIDLEDSYKRAEDLRIAVRELIIKHEKNIIPLSTSIGLASFPLHAQSAEAMLLAVDDALYQAKHLGRDKVVVYGA